MVVSKIVLPLHYKVTNHLKTDVMKSINQLVAIAGKSGFEMYGSFNEGELQHEILTCTNGKYSGEVIDIYYKYYGGDIIKIAYSTQFVGQNPTFCFS